MKKYLLAQYDLHQRLYNNVLQDFTDEESNMRWSNNKKVNYVKYLAGHLSIIIRHIILVRSDC